MPFEVPKSVNWVLVSSSSSPYSAATLRIAFITNIYSSALSTTNVQSSEYNTKSA